MRRRKPFSTPPWSFAKIVASGSFGDCDTAIERAALAPSFLGFFLAVESLAKDTDHAVRSLDILQGQA
ncbi:MAG TPA: hypothetical protein VED85_03155, partial [Burkholderiaceae bacterium]|nr:hypothetical protein [Burkholderiaceae bacterium]